MSVRLFLFVALASILPASSASAWCRMVTGAGVQPSDGSSCAPLATASDHYLFWTHRCSELSISSALPPHFITIAQAQDVFRTAAATWAASDCGMGLDLSPQFNIAVLTDTNECTISHENIPGNNVNSVMFVNDESDWTNTRMWSPNAFAVTLAWHLQSTGEIVGVDMEINEARGEWMICDASGCVDGTTRCPLAGCGRDGGPVDLQNVITHELGHYLGIGHTTADHPEATMLATAQFGELTMRDLANDDIDGLCSAYPVGSLADSCDPTPVGGLSLDCQSHYSGCGCAVPGSGPASDRSGWIGLGLIGALVVLRRRKKA